MGMEQSLGSLEAGKLADLIVVRMAGKANYTPWIISSMENTISNLVYSGSCNDVETVVINGDVVMEEKKFLKFDAKALLSRAQEVGMQSLLRAKLM